MDTLTIKGDYKQLEIVAKTIRLRAAKYGLEVSLVKDKKQEDVIPPAKPTEVVETKEADTPPTANQVKEIIEAIDNVKDLNQYKKDKRQVVKTAYNKKLKELTGK